MNLLITGARVLDPSQGLDAMLDILIEEGFIARVDKKIKAANVETIDASGLVATPGFIDLHTHLREPGQEHKETIATGTRAAVTGAAKSGPRWSIVGMSIALSTRSGTFVGPGICRKCLPLLTPAPG